MRRTRGFCAQFSLSPRIPLNCQGLAGTAGQNTSDFEKAFAKGRATIDIVYQNPRSRKTVLIKACVQLVLILAACLSSRAAQQPVPGTVYLVVGSDTAIWNAVGTVDVYTRYPYYPQNSFTDSNAPIFQVMDPSWRQQFKDSYGQPIKFTWWMMGGNIYRDATNLNVPLANTMTLHLMQKYHGEAIRQFGDQLSLHYHTYMWSDYNGTGVYYWNQTKTFNERRADFDVTLAQYLLEEGVFPVSFRSGWHFMDQDWQQYLNQLVPYCFHNNCPTVVPWYTNAGPIAGVENWSRAPSVFVPFHPSTNDYQMPGDSTGWNVRSIKIQNLVQTNLDQMFFEASNGVDQLVCLWDHLPENFVANIARLASMVGQSASNNPSVPFRYCTAVEAMQRWRGLTNVAAPRLEVMANVQGPTVSLVITSSVPIFQQRPFVCFRDAFQQYTNVTAACLPAGSNTWTIDLGRPTNLLAKVAVAVTDEAGNLATQTLRYLPDDLFLDNLDPEYSEGQGTWTSTTNAAWGTDARLMLLESNNTADAGWVLPLTWSGRYRLSVQVPTLPNPATNVHFNVWSAGTNIVSVTFPGGIPANQWAFLASVVLDQAVSNRVEMVISGTNQAGAFAVADVLRVIPISEASVPVVDAKTPIIFIPDLSGYLLRFQAKAGNHYLVQRTSDLSSGWSTLQFVSPAAAQILEFVDSKPPPSQAFYRVLEQ
jgi:hypothetical protein